VSYPPVVPFRGSASLRTSKLTTSGARRFFRGSFHSPPQKVFLNLRGTKMTFSIFSILGDWDLESYPMGGVWILRRAKYVHVFESGFFSTLWYWGSYLEPRMMYFPTKWGAKEHQNSQNHRVVFGRGPALWMAKGNWRSQWFAGCLSTWWFYNMFYFYPHPSGNDPSWRAYFKCSNGLVQPPTSSL